jgi:hypothetical protein
MKERERDRWTGQKHCMYRRKTSEMEGSGLPMDLKKGENALEITGFTVIFFNGRDDSSVCIQRLRCLLVFVDYRPISLKDLASDRCRLS